MKQIFVIILLGFLTLAISSCKKKKGCTDSSAVNYDLNAKKDDGSCTFSNPVALPPISETSNVKGYRILEKISGIWNGAVYSPTPLGSFSE